MIETLKFMQLTEPLCNFAVMRGCAVFHNYRTPTLIFVFSLTPSKMSPSTIPEIPDSRAPLARASSAALTAGDRLAAGEIRTMIMTPSSDDVQKGGGMMWKADRGNQAWKGIC